MRKEEITATDKARIPLWLAHDMSFVVSHGDGITIIPKYTRCEKVPYSQRTKRYLTKMEEKTMTNKDPNRKAVCVNMKGMDRYLWRTDVLTKKEYDIARESDKSSALKILKAKSKGSVGKRKSSR